MKKIIRRDYAPASAYVTTKILDNMPLTQQFDEREGVYSPDYTIKGLVLEGVVEFKSSEPYDKERLISNAEWLEGGQQIAKGMRITIDKNTPMGTARELIFHCVATHSGTGERFDLYAEPVVLYASGKAEERWGIQWASKCLQYDFANDNATAQVGLTISRNGEVLHKDSKEVVIDDVMVRLSLNGLPFSYTRMAEKKPENEGYNNLIKNSERMSIGIEDGTEKVTNFYKVLVPNLPPNKDYTFSVEDFTINGADGFDIVIYNTKKGEQSQAICSTSRKVVTLQSKQGGDLLVYRGRINKTDQCTQLDLVKIKLEEGKSATPWTPHPSEFAGAFNNLLKDSHRKSIETDYAFGFYRFSEDMQPGEWYTLTGRIRTPKNRDKLVFYSSEKEIETIPLEKDKWQTFTHTFMMHKNYSAKYNSLVFYLAPWRNEDTSANGVVEVDWFKLEPGLRATPWTPCASEKQQGVTFNTTGTTGTYNCNLLSHKDDVLQAELLVCPPNGGDFVKLAEDELRVVRKPNIVRAETINNAPLSPDQEVYRDKVILMDDRGIIKHPERYQVQWEATYQGGKKEQQQGHEVQFAAKNLTEIEYNLTEK